MVNFIFRRLIISVFMLIGISFVSFIVIQLPPGDFASSYETYLVNQGGMSHDQAIEAADRMRERYGLNDPLVVQYFSWVKGIVTEGQFGFSFAYRKDVGELIAERLPRTLLLALMAHAISTFLGVGIGIVVAPRQYSVIDNVSALFAFVMTSVPRFWIALVIMYVLVFVFDQHHVTSFFSPEYAVAPWSIPKFLNFLQHIWPVVFIAGLGGIARNMRVMRGNLLDVLNQQYVTTARSKGLTENKTINRHAVPNALHPIIAYQGTALPYMVQGELEAAIVMNIPTMAPLFYDSLLTQDIYISGSFLLVYGAMIVIGNLLADVFMAVLDPRIRYS